MYPLNAWYAAAWDTEVGRSLTARTLCDQPIVLYRTTTGGIACLADACWHRLVPLSMGALSGDEVVCGYHGLVYGPNGRCVRMPAQETLNPSAAVRSYPAVERHRFVWVWPGDPAAADPDLIPDMHWNKDPEWAAEGRTIELACDYRLVLDNLMDLTHEEFLHADSIGGEALSIVEPQVAHDEDSVTLTRWMVGIEPPPFMLMQLRHKTPGFTGLVDRWQIITFTAPATISIDVGIAPTGTGAPEGDRSQGMNGFVMNTLMPSVEGSCLYHWAYGRNFAQHDHGFTTTLINGIAGVFSQDTAMLNAQQKAIMANPDHDFYNLNIDVGGMWSRRLIDAQVAREQGRTRTHPTRLAAVAADARRLA